MNGILSPELLAERMADIERQMHHHHPVPARSAHPVRKILGHALVVIGTRLEGQPTMTPSRVR